MSGHEEEDDCVEGAAAAVQCCAVLLQFGDKLTTVSGEDKTFKMRLLIAPDCKFEKMTANGSISQHLGSILGEQRTCERANVRASHEAFDERGPDAQFQFCEAAAGKGQLSYAQQLWHGRWQGERDTGRNCRPSAVEFQRGKLRYSTHHVHQRDCVEVRR